MKFYGLKRFDSSHGAETCGKLRCIDVVCKPSETKFGPSLAERGSQFIEVKDAE